jgi:hypothetical protein
MVTRSYMLNKPRGRLAASRYLHWHAMPAVIDVLGAVEVRLEQVAMAVRRSPALPLAGALTLGVVLGLLRPRKARR